MLTIGSRGEAQWGMAMSAALPPCALSVTTELPGPLTGVVRPPRLGDRPGDGTRPVAPSLSSSFAPTSTAASRATAGRVT